MFSKLIKSSKEAVPKVRGAFKKFGGQKVRSGFRRIIVSSNCQTGSIAAALQVIFPNDELIPVPLTTFTNESDELTFIDKLREADIWISIGQYELLEKYKLSERIKLVRIPRIRFSAFHPDLVYAKRPSTNELYPDYNSAIAVWAYKNGIDVQDAKKLFNADSFAGLGYLNSWEPCVNSLKQIFKDTDIDFSEFFFGVRREGLFMHTLNHPKVQVLARLAKLISLRMGMDKDVMERYIDIRDGLDVVIWPLYPEIGDMLALRSGYEWKIGHGKWIIGVEAYLEYAYANYADQQISPEDIMAVGVDERLFDRVLGGQLGIKHG